MKACQTKPRKAFTLIELLVVIAIIALLMSIIVPALNKAKLMAQKTLCANNIRSQALGVRLYAEQNDGVVPYNVGGNWFWDMSFYSTNQIRQLADIDHKSFFCPANKLKKSDDARFWQYSWVGQSDGPQRPVVNTMFVPLKDETSLTITRQKELFRVLSYVYMFERLNSSGTSMYAGITELRTREKPIWIRKMSDLRNASGTVMIADATISQVENDNFDQITAGGLYSMYQIHDTSNHFSSRRSTIGLKGYLPSGGHVAFADGHVVWRDYPDQLKCRLLLGMYFYW